MPLPLLPLIVLIGLTAAEIPCHYCGHQVRMSIVPNRVRNVDMGSEVATDPKKWIY